MLAEIWHADRHEVTEESVWMGGRHRGNSDFVILTPKATTATW